MAPNKLLAQAMKDQHYGKKEIAARIGTDEKTVEEWLRGKSEPGSQFVPKLCALFGKTPAELGLSQGLPGTLLCKQVCSGNAATHALLHAHAGMREVKQRVRKNRLILLLMIAIVIALLVAGEAVSLRFSTDNAESAAGSLIFFYHTPDRGIHSTSIDSVAWSPDSRFLACATGDGTVQIFDLNKKAEVFTYAGQHGGVNQVAWLPNGQDIASVSVDHTLEVWNAFTGRVIFSTTGPSSLWSVTVSPDGTFIAWSGKDALVHVWNLVTRKPVYTYVEQAQSGGIRGLAFSADGSLLASGDNTGEVQVWDALNGENSRTYESLAGLVNDLKWSSDDRYLAVASADGAVRVWDTFSDTLAYKHHFQANMLAVSWAPGGLRLASASADGSVQLWDALSGKHGFLYRHHSGAVLAVAWSPNGALIASGDESGALQVWNEA